MLEKTESRLEGRHYSFSFVFITMPHTLLNLPGYYKTQLKNNLQITMAWFTHFLRESWLWTKCFSWPTRMKGKSAHGSLVATGWLLVSKSANRTDSSWSWFTAVEELACISALPVSPVRALPPWFMYLPQPKHWAYSGDKGVIFHSLYRNGISDSECWLFQTYANEMALFYSPVSVNSLVLAKYS